MSVDSMRLSSDMPFMLVKSSFNDTQSIAYENENTQMKRKLFIEAELGGTFQETEIKREANFEKVLKPTDKDSFYGLPKTVKTLLKSLRNIDSLYDWQHELLTKMEQNYLIALQNDNCKLDNLLYLSPTSGGKTLVAELLMLKCLLVRRKNCIFVMPFVSIVQEKVQMLDPFGESLNFYVEEYAGSRGIIPPIKRQASKNKPTLYICTIEKAYSLLNSLLELDRLNELGLVFADEIHMIGDGYRGAIYEMILSKVKYCSKRMKCNKMNINISKEQQQKQQQKLSSDKQPENKLGIQIVATTATLENKEELAEFLDAYLYEKQFRPVELKEYIKLDNKIFEIDKSKLRASSLSEEDSFVHFRRKLNLNQYTSEQKAADPDGLVALVSEIVPNESCLIFCSTKKNCENLAQLLATHLPSSLKTHKRDLKLKLFNDLKEENNNNVCPILRQSLQVGVSYHHSGLTMEERQLIEDAYRAGTIQVITCTSTLAAGVNLPAKRVIIRSPYVGRDFISSNTYKQMVGRAGRAGLVDSAGESFLLFQVADKQKVYDLLVNPLKPCNSSFQYEDFKAVRSLVLSLICLNLAKSGFELLDFFKETFFFLQIEAKAKRDTNNPIKEELLEEKEKADGQPAISSNFKMIADSLSYLIEKKFLSIQTSLKVSNKSEEDTPSSLYMSYFEITKLGAASIKANIDLDCVHQLHFDLRLALKCIVLSNYLHLIYLCTPYDLINSVNNMDFDVYSRKVLISY
jgi:POLQ-like helicase